MTNLQTKQAALDNLHNEGGEGYRGGAQITLADEQAYYERCMIDLEAAKTAKDAKFAAEWTVEVLTARRAAWNAEMKALSAAKKQMTSLVMRTTIAKLGYGLDDIQRAKVLHGIV